MVTNMGFECECQLKVKASVVCKQKVLTTLEGMLGNRARKFFMPNEYISENLITLSPNCMIKTGSLIR